MALDVTAILERFVNNEFILIVDMFLVFSKLAGITFFINFALEWFSVAKYKSGNQQFASMRDQQASMKRACLFFIASTLMWRFGNGIAAWGELIWGVSETTTQSPYTQAVYQNVIDNASVLVNNSVSNSGYLVSPIALKASFAVCSLYGLYSYTKGIIGLTTLGHPQSGGQMTKGMIVTHITFGILLIYVDLFYASISATMASSVS